MDATYISYKYVLVSITFKENIATDKLILMLFHYDFYITETYNESFLKVYIFCIFLLILNS